MHSTTDPDRFTDHEAEIARLREQIDGDLFVPTDEGFTAACLAWNLRFAHKPAVVVVAGHATDIARAVRLAHQLGMPVTVQATGHGVARVADDGFLIITSRLTDVHIDQRHRRARVACGAKWGAVLAPAQAHGLAPLLGSSTAVGAVGYTLGGGMGWLGRKHGLASDSVTSFEVVLPNGDEVVASAQTNTELFWGLKGGGAGSLGVVTAMTIDLHPVTEVYAGNLFYPIEMAAEVMTRYRSWIADIDTDMTSSVGMINFPPIDAVPEPLRGGSFAFVRGCWSGEPARGAELVDQWRAWKAPVVDLFGPMPFTSIDLVSSDPVDPMGVALSTEWFDALPDAAIEILVDAATPCPGLPPSLLVVELRHAGGAIRANAEGVVNRRGRSGELLLSMIGPVFDPQQGAAVTGHIAQVRHDLAPMVSGAVYTNFLEGPERQERTGDAFDEEAMRRLQILKAEVDPTNSFGNGLRISPTAPSC